MAKIVPTQIFVIDWDDNDVVLGPGSANALVPTDYDYEHGSQITHIHAMIGLRGSFDVADPDGVLDPVVLAAGTAARVRLEQPHRFWGYTLHGQATDATPRVTGWAIVDRRLNAHTATFRLVSVDFVELRNHVVVPQFNVDRAEPAPPLRTRPDLQPFVLDGPVCTVVAFEDLINEGTAARINFTFENLDTSVARVGFYIELVNATETRSVYRTTTPDPDGSKRQRITLVVTPGYEYRVYGSVFADFSFEANGTFTVPGGCS